MQKITRRQHRERPWVRWAVLAAALAALIAVGWIILKTAAKDGGVSPAATEETPGGFSHAARGVPLTPSGGGTAEAAGGTPDLASIAVTLPDGTSWTAYQTEPGVLTVHADGSVYPMRDTLAAAMLYDAAGFTARSVLADDMSGLPEPLSAYGLDPPRQTVTLTYADGSGLTLHIGTKNAGLDEAFYYMTAEGDPRLFSVDAATAEDFAFEAPLLRAIEQPVLHASRIDRVEVEDADGLRVWELDGDIADPDAADRWMLTAPFRYACDGGMIRNLRRNLENLSMASWIGDATAEMRAAYGFDAPRARITVHQSAGTILGVGAGGAIEEQDWEDDTFELLLGTPQSDLVDRVLWAGSVWTIPHFRLAGILSLTPMNSLNTYVVPVSLSNLRRLTVEADGETHVWEITRAGDGGAGEDGGITVTRDGQPLAYSVFEANYNRLLMVTVSGVLPEDWTSEKTPHTVMTFETETGVTRTVALADFNGMQDAVITDGTAVFRLVKGAMAFTAE